MATSEEIRAQSYVGFDSITQQIEHKLLKRGFQFNVIVVGEHPFLFRVLVMSVYEASEEVAFAERM
jgi:septin family protein